MIGNFINAHPGVLFSALIAIAGALWGLFARKSAQTVKARADLKVAVVAQQAAEQDTAAAQAQTKAVQVAASAQQQAQDATAQNIDEQLRAVGALRKE